MSKAVLIGIAIAALCAFATFRRPYVVETIALEIYCPDHPNTAVCFLYSHFGVLFVLQEQTRTPVCASQGYHFVGYNSDGAVQCCGTGFHLERSRYKQMH